MARVGVGEGDTRGIGVYNAMGGGFRLDLLELCNLVVGLLQLLHHIMAVAYEFLVNFEGHASLLDELRGGSEGCEAGRSALPWLLRARRAAEELSRLPVLCRS